MTLARILRIATQRLRSLLRKRRADAELTQELGFHYDQLVQEYLAGGMGAPDARDAARKMLGNVGLLEEECRDQRRVTWLHDAMRDALYGLRMLRKSPGLVVVAAGSLALGIGANTAILATAEEMLLGSLPYPDAERLVMVRTFPLANPGQVTNVSLPDFFAFKEQTQSFESIGCSLADQKTLRAGEDGAVPEKIYGQGFSAGMFDTLGVRPLIGRTFNETDYSRGPPFVVVLSHRLWKRRFGADTHILGKHIRLNGASSEVVGVMPPDFRFAEERVEYWVPMAIDRTPLQAGVRYFIVAARLRRDRTIEQAQAELSNAAAQLAMEFPATHEHWGARAQTIRDALFGWSKHVMLTLETAVVMVFLIACANVTGLLLARGSSRRREMAMRAALGAGRVRIIRQLITESLMLSSLGGVLGLAVAWAALHAVPAITPPPYAPRLREIPLNFRMLLLTGLTSTVAGLIFGIGPALAVLRQDLIATLKQPSHGWRTPGVRYRLRGALVAAQIAFAFVLLIGAGLALKSFARLAGRDLNFDPHGLVTFEFRLSMPQFMHVVGSYQGFPYMALDPPPAPRLERIFDRLRLLPGAESVAGISIPPVNSLLVPSMNVTVEGSPPGESPGDAAYFLITPNFFATVKTPVVLGRDFEAGDRPGATWVAVINETAAHRFWPGQNPLGKRFSLDSVPDDLPREVIGVVRDIPTQTRQTTAQPVIYASYLQQPLRYRLPWANMLGQMTFLVRSSGNPMTLAPEAQKAVAEIEPEVPLSNIAPMEQYTRAWTEDLSYYAFTLGVFAAVAALLAAMGTYGVMAYTVAQRRHEIGIRVALGARPLQVFRLVSGQMVLLIGIGLASGYAGARVLTKLLAAQLWNVAPTDPEAFAGALLLVILAAGIAFIGPLRRCAQVNPVRALRGE